MLFIINGKTAFKFMMLKVSKEGNILSAWRAETETSKLPADRRVWRCWDRHFKSLIFKLFSIRLLAASGQYSLTIPNWFPITLAFV